MFEAKSEAINESGVIDTGKAIGLELDTFLDLVIKKSKGYVKTQRDAAILLTDILKDRY